MGSPQGPPPSPPLDRQFQERSEVLAITFRAPHLVPPLMKFSGGTAQLPSINQFLDLSESWRTFRKLCSGVLFSVSFTAVCQPRNTSKFSR